VQDIESPGPLQNVISRKRCVTESATGQMPEDEFSLEAYKGKISYNGGGEIEFYILMELKYS